MEIASLILEPTLLQRIREAQKQDTELHKTVQNLSQDRFKEFQVDERGTLKMNGRVCVPNDEEIKKQLMHEAHYSGYAMHPGETQPYQELKNGYWWKGMKKDIAEFVARCETCQRFKIKHQRSSGLLQPLSIPE